VIDLESHPFYVGALFVPQPTGDPARPHALVAALLAAARAAARSLQASSR
jgi:CTP synthase (UTP-ammonia lyase)